jgi:alcohol dehydrogenase
MADPDKATFLVATGFIIAFLFHVINKNIPASVDAWPAAASRTGASMNAVIYEKVNGDLRLVENHPRPVIRPNQVLVQVKFSSLNPCDFKFRRNWAPHFLVPKPKIPGEDLSGIIVEIGSEVDASLQLKVGDRVAAMMPILGSRWGSLAEYAAIDSSLVAKLGDNTTLEDAAAIPLVALTTVQALEKLDMKHRKSILIQAGAGGVGTFAIQYAKNVFKMERIATTASAAKAALLHELGADVVIDYRIENFEDTVQGYDVVLDTMSWAYEERTLTKGVLKNRGHYLNIMSSDWFHDGTERANGIGSVLNCVYSKIRNLILPGHVPRYDIIVVNPNGQQLKAILDLLDNGTIRSIIDRTFPLRDANEAFAYLEQGHATGKVVMEHDMKKEIKESSI